jgi:flagellar basal-body rod protein FlgB
MKLFDATLSTLERALDTRLARQSVLAGNLANADTPGFVPRELDFSAAMQAARAPAVAAPAGGPARDGDVALSAAGGSPEAPERFVVDDARAAPGLDGNGVDVDRTMGAIAENAIQYGAAAKAAAKKLAILRYVASDGNA